MTRTTDKAIDETMWQAEQIVREGMKKTPEYKKAVRQTVKTLKKAEAEARVTLRKSK